MEEKWYAKSAEEIYELLETNIETGLSNEQAESKRS